ncbi:MAG: ABC transporter permease [Halobacteriota archaeon]
MKFAKITSKGMRETFRDRRGFLFLLVFPIFFIAVFSFAFGSGTFQSGGSLPHDIAVVNYDVGTAVISNNTTRHVNYGHSFTEVLQNATLENSSTKLFRLHNVSEEQANELLRSRSIDTLIVIPKNFSGAFTSMVNNSARTAITSQVGAQAIASGTVGQNQVQSSPTRTPNQTSAPTPVIGAAVSANPTGNALPKNVTLPKASNVTSLLSVQGDASYINFDTGLRLITTIFDQYKNDVTAKAVANAASGGDYRPLADYIPIEMQPIAGTQSFSPFDYMVPGLIILAILLQVSLVSASLVRDIERGTLDRLKLSVVRAFDLLFGTLLAWTLVTLAQVPLLIAVATGLGYNYSGGSLSSLELAIVIGVIAGMASIALALLIASFAKNEMQALELGAMITLPLAFLGGAFFPLPPQVIEFRGMTFSVYDALPWTHAISALRSVLTYGTGLSADIVVQIVWLIVLTAILFVVAVACYSRVRLRPET